MPSDVLMNRHMAKLGMAPQPVSWSDSTLTIHEVSKFFSVPIAEAATKLSEQLDPIRLIADAMSLQPWKNEHPDAFRELVRSCVCGSFLQRICKENGIARWPFRKVTAGKSVEEIIEEGVKELATNPGAYKIAEKQPPPTPENTSGSPLATPPISGTLIGPDAAMNIRHPSPKRLARQHQEAATMQPSQAQKSTQRTVSAAAQTRSPAQGNNTPPLRVINQQSTPSHMHSSPAAAAAAPIPPKQKPASTVDDFKFGFPSKGLRRHSTKWWGSSEKETAATTAAEDRDVELESSSVEGLDTGSVSEGSFPTASSLLVRTRRKASQRGRDAIAHAVTRGYGLHKLGAKDAATLRFVFGDYLPQHWTSAFPPVP